MPTVREKSTSILIAAASAALIIGQVGCSTVPTSQENLSSEAKPPLPCARALQIPIGTVHMVDQGGQFVLIKSSRTTELEPDAQIISYGPDARMSSHLKASPARKGAFLTADLVDGLPSVGDLVMVVQSMSRKPGEDGESGFVDSDIQVLE